MTTAKFLLGQTVATPGALQALADASQSPLDFLQRHQQGEWGDLTEEDKMENEYSVN